MEYESARLHSIAYENTNLILFGVYPPNTYGSIKDVFRICCNDDIAGFTCSGYVEDYDSFVNLHIHNTFGKHVLGKIILCYGDNKDILLMACTTKTATWQGVFYSQGSPVIKDISGFAKYKMIKSALSNRAITELVFD